jgi:hypothetical protein
MEPKQIMMRHALEFCNWCWAERGGLLLALDSGERARDAEEREQGDDSDHDESNHMFSS